MKKLTGVREIMRDISLSMESNCNTINLSAGNPVVLPEFTKMWKLCSEEINDLEYGNAIGEYGASRGYAPFIETICQLLNEYHGWNIAPKNCLIAPGTQPLYFMLLNIFSGQNDSQTQEVYLPFSPEYTGYNGVQLAENLIHAEKPLIKSIDEYTFRYEIDFEKVEQNYSQYNCLLTSRPNNPSGLVTSQEEIQRLVDLSQKSDIPLIIDSAYGLPIPGLSHVPINYPLTEQTIYCFSLSKAGLPGERVGVLIANEDIVEVVHSFQSNLFIHSSHYGQLLANIAIRKGLLQTLCSERLQPFYTSKQQLIKDLLKHKLKNIPCKAHSMEGALFSWLYFEDLPISDKELYILCKAENLFIVPGFYFFFGQKDKSWSHKYQCIRLSLTASDEDIIKGVDVLQLILEKVYSRVQIKGV